MSCRNCEEGGHPDFCRHECYECGGKPEDLNPHEADCPVIAEHEEAAEIQRLRARVAKLERLHAAAVANVQYLEESRRLTTEQRDTAVRALRECLAVADHVNGYTNAVDRWAVQERLDVARRALADIEKPADKSTRHAANIPGLRRALTHLRAKPLMGELLEPIIRGIEYEIEHGPLTSQAMDAAPPDKEGYRG